ncbi:MAG TPA: glycosyltransferase [Planctomycetaceae bacterium]|nr:glycosyltransferase [Planctomycetaceae bacterium]
MIKLLLVIPTLDRSGAEKQFSLLATRLPRDEFDVHCVALTRGGPYEAELAARGIPLTILRKRFKFDPFTLRRLRRTVEQLQPDVMHTWLFAANAYGRIVAGNSPRPKVIVSERCVDTWKSGWQLWLDRRQIDRTARLVANSQAVADFYRQQGFPAERIAVIPNGVEVPDADPTFDRAAALAKFDIPPEAAVIGYAGRLARQKRVKDLIWGFQLLRQVVDRPVYFLIVGDGPERSRCERWGRSFGCTHLLRFAGHRDDAERLIGLFDVAWLASDFEGLSNFIMEAMARGIPVVASDIPPNRELVVDGETGFVVQVGDSVGFSQFTDRILADPDMARRLGEAGRKRMREEFSVERMVAGHVELYRGVLAGA